MNAQIEKAKGETPSERYLAKLGDESFLNLWSYPNVFIDKKQNGKGKGKELCDLLVVCGNHVIVFSDKSIEYQQNKDPTLAWKRWYKSAIQTPAEKLNGAIKWLQNHPNRIFLDKNCTKPFPIKLPPPEDTVFHAITVALGSKHACKDILGGSGSLLIKPSLIGNDHIDEDHKEFSPFAIGDVTPEKAFVHVFDDITLDIVMKELDTISDFTEYLTKKERFVRSGFLDFAYGEEDLLAYYILNYCLKTNERDFLNPNGKPWKKGEHLVIEEGSYEKLAIHPQYIAKKEADRVSYIWDKLITNFTQFMLQGELVEYEDQPYCFDESEEVLRTMAFESRFNRRNYGNAFRQLTEKYQKNMSRLCRAVLSPPDTSNPNSENGYVFLLFKYPDDLPFPEGYNEYRSERRALLYAYCLHYANKNRHIKRFIGMAVEPPASVTGKKGSSEDLLMVEIDDWDEETVRAAEKGAEICNIGKPENMTLGRLQGDEFPKQPDGSYVGIVNRSPLNRKQRRAMRAKNRKNK